MEHRVYGVSSPWVSAGKWVTFGILTLKPNQSERTDQKVQTSQRKIAINFEHCDWERSSLQESSFQIKTILLMTHNLWAISCETHTFRLLVETQFDFLFGCRLNDDCSSLPKALGHNRNWSSQGIYLISINNRRSMRTTFWVKSCFSWANFERAPQQHQFIKFTFLNALKPIF